MATTLPSEPLPSPTFTNTSTSSFDLVVSSPRSRSSTISDLAAQSDSEEEIVWTVARHRRVSAAVESSSSTEDDSEDDFVVLSRRRQSGVPHSSGNQRSSPAAPHNCHHSHPTNPSTPTSLSTSLARFSLSDDSVSQGTCSDDSDDSDDSDVVRGTPVGSSGSSVAVKVGGHSRPSPSHSSVGLLKPPSPSRRKKRGGKKKSKRASQSGLGERPIVDDFSESAVDDCASESDIGSQISVYEEAVQFITLFLTNPDEYNNTSGRLTFLQSIIIELGLSTSVPSSVTSAKAILKSQAFVNVREYLASLVPGPLNQEVEKTRLTSVD
ncbi:hypothetical protein AAF712_001411 [Marasmius tenuissimus]|uniref:Uncharacterized protein n=1 Tax=Marasmius tenuissimus TaxID=585030 RepID=A0ABR3ADZ0_9AGAR